MFLTFLGLEPSVPKVSHKKCVEDRMELVCWQLRLGFLEHCSSTKDFWICRFVDKNDIDKNSTKKALFFTMQ